MSGESVDYILSRLHMSRGLVAIKFDFSDLGFVYTTLFALSLVLINPWGAPFGGIWTTPKVYIVIALALLSWSVLFARGLRVSCG